MSDLQTELLGLQKLQLDFQRIKDLDKKIQDVKDEIDSDTAHHVEVELPTPPSKDESKSKAMRKKASEGASGTYACLYTLCLVVAAVVSLFIGLQHGALLAILGAGIVWVCGAFGPIWTIAGCGVGTWIGWKCWSQANTTQAIILILMAIGTIIFASLYKKANESDEDMLAAIKEQEELEARAYKLAQESYEKAVEKAKKKNAEAAKIRNKEFYDEIDALKAQQRQIRNEIDQNPVLDNSDKKEEVVAFLISQIQRKRATSLAQALQLYDAKTEQEKRAEIERLDRQLQADLDRFNRDQQIRREADEQFNQAMHRLRVEKEQRRQTEELERIRRELER